MAKIINTDTIVKTLLKMSGNSYPAGGFHGEWVDTQLYLEADKMRDKIQSEANARVRRRRSSGGYHDSIVVGNPYTYRGIRSIRVYAKRPSGSHANLIEYGWRVRAYGNARHVAGKYVFDAGAKSIEDQAGDIFVANAKKRLEDMIR